MVPDGVAILGHGVPAELARRERLLERIGVEGVGRLVQFQCQRD
jgi:hypothetical protein